MGFTHYHNLIFTNDVYRASGAYQSVEEATEAARQKLASNDRIASVELIEGFTGEVVGILSRESESITEPVADPAGAESVTEPEEGDSDAGVATEPDTSDADSSE